MSELSIQDWGAIGEIAGGIAVIVSLLYLAVQVRQNTRHVKSNLDAARLASFEASAQSGNHFRELLARDRELTDLFLRGLEGFETLDKTDRFRMDMLLRNLFSETQRTYVRETTLKSNAEGPKRIIEDIVASRAVREWLKEERGDWLPEFRAYVDELVAARQAEEAGAASDS